MQIAHRPCTGATRMPRSAYTLACALATLAALAGLRTSPARAASTCPNEALRQGPSANLPDCRAYELVSPPDKNGGQVEGGFNFAGGAGQRGGAPMQAALNGEAVTYASGAVFNESAAKVGALANQYLSKRTPAGWRTQEITPEQDFPEGRFDASGGAVDYSLYQGFSEDLSHGFLLSYEPPLVAGAPAGYYDPYVRNDEDGAYTLLNTTKPPAWSPGELAAEVVSVPDFKGFVSRFAGGNSGTGGVPAFSHVIFEADDALTPATAAAPAPVPGRKNLYEYNEGEGLELVSVLPDGKAAEAVAPRFVEAEEIRLFNFGSAHLENYSPSYVSAISADGSRAFWTGPEGVVYLHERTAAGARTVQLSAGPAQFWAAASDGSFAYFTEGGLNAGNEFEATGDLDRYDVETAEVTEVAPGGGSVLGTSEDGAYVYFDSGAVLTSAPSGEGQAPVPGAGNLYLWHEGTTTFVAAGDGGAENAVGSGGRPVGGDANPGANLRTSRVTPNGRFVVFNSSDPLTGYDSFGKSEVFEYSAAANRVVCVSCNPSGIPPTGSSYTPIEYHTEESVPGWASPTVQQRYVNDEGRVFFDSSDALLPQASNGKVNVYEYEWPGTGSCQGESGCIYLISSGVSSENSWFLDASANGEDVFFLTTQQLVGQDIDEAFDVYDARVDGGFPYGSAPPCTGEACRPAIAPAPQIYTAPASQSFEGAGNPVSPPAVTTTKTTKPKVKKKAKSKKKHKRAKRAKRAGRDGRGKS